MDELLARFGLVLLLLLHVSDGFVVQRGEVRAYVQAVQAHSQSINNLKKSCCYGHRTVDHGAVILSDPSRCFQLVCEKGFVVQKHVQKEGDLNCCEFNHLLYPNGAQLEGYCMPMLCNRGQWIPNGTLEDCCNHCYLYNDPHIITFDGTKYDWHGTCNYSVAQSHFSTKPEVGVFSDFSACNGLASCLSHTTFRNDPHTIVSLDNGAITHPKINGHENTIQDEVQPLNCDKSLHPVLSWKHENCIFLLGSSRLLLLHCPNRLDLWAHPFHSGKLNGLCGHYNQYQKDDFTDRQGKVHTPTTYWPLAFPNSWLTSEQSERTCDDPCPECQEETTIDPCKSNATHRAFFSKICSDRLQLFGNFKNLNHHIDTCSFDLCLIHQSGGDEDDANRWAKQVHEMLLVTQDFY